MNVSEYVKKGYHKERDDSGRFLSFGSKVKKIRKQFDEIEIKKTNDLGRVF